MFTINYSKHKKKNNTQRLPRYNRNSYRRRLYSTRYERTSYKNLLLNGINKFTKYIGQSTIKTYNYLKNLVGSSNSDKHENCSICLSSLEETEKHTKWICRHRFHKDCIESWDGCCPICRCNHKLITYTF